MDNGAWMGVSLALFGYLAWQVVLAPLIDWSCRRHDTLPSPTLVNEHLRRIQMNQFLRS